MGKLKICNTLAMIDNAEDYAEINANSISKIDGIIGWEIIHNMDVTIDYAYKYLIVKKPVKRQNNSPNLFSLERPIVKVTAETAISLYFFFDTGANSTSFTSKIKRKIEFKNSKKAKMRIGGAGGFEETDVEIITEKCFFVNKNKIVCKDVVIRERTEFINIDGIFGGDIAQKGYVRFDYTNGMFEIKCD